jgi:RNA polymerase sigma-70 factor (ECF subfamily)
MHTLQPVHSEDLSLVARIVSGDEIAADEFARHFSERFAYLAHRNGIPVQDCEDVAQEAMLTAMGEMQRGLFRGEGKLGSWLARIFYGTMMDYYRARKGAVVVTLDDDGAVLNAVEAMPAPMTDYETIAIVHEAVGSLPPQHRAILLYKRTEGYTLKEISQMLEMTIGQVRDKLYAAEEMVRRRLRNERPPDVKTRSKALLPGKMRSSEGDHEQSNCHPLFIQLFSTGGQQVDHSILLRARERAGAASGRGSFVRMRMLLARSAATGCGSACVEHRSQLTAIANAC